MFEIRLVCSRATLQKLRRSQAARREIAGIVVLDLVVVPGQHPRVRGVGGLQVRVELVGRVARPVGGEGERRRTFVPAQAQPRIARLVDVVADEEDEIELARGDLAVRHEAALFVVLARRERDAQVIDPRRRRRCGAGASDRALCGAGREAIEVGCRGAQAVDFDMHAVAVLGACRHASAAPAALEMFVLGDLPADVDGRHRQPAVDRVRRRRKARPQHHRAGPRHAARHAEPERIAGALEAAHGRCRRARRPRRAAEQAGQRQHRGASTQAVESFAAGARPRARDERHGYDSPVWRGSCLQDCPRARTLPIR